MRKKDVPILMLFLALILNGCDPGKKKTAFRLGNKEREAEGENNIKILDEHVVAMAKFLGKNHKSYRMHIRTDVDGAKIYRQVGRYIIVDSSGEVIYVPDRI